MLRPLKILVVEDNESDTELIIEELRLAGFDPRWRRVDTEPEYIASLHPDTDLVISDYAMPRFSGLRALEALQERGLEIPFVIVSGNIGEDVAVLAMKRGAADYVLKDRLTRLGPAVEQALNQRELRRDRKRSTEALKLFRNLVDQSSDTFEVVDPKTGRFLDVSGKGCVELGYTREEYLALRLFDVVPEVKEETWPQIVETLRAEGMRHGEALRRRKDGSAYPVEFNAKWVCLDRAYIVVIVRDITERKRAEEILRKRSPEKTGLLKEFAVTLGICGLVYGILSYTSPFQNVVREYAINNLDFLDNIVEILAIVVLGFSTFLYRRWREFQDQTSRQIYVQRALQTLHGELETRVQQRTAELARSNELLRAEIAERARAQEKLREQADLLDKAQDAILVCDLAGSVAYWNKSAERLYGWTAEEASGRSVKELLYRDDTDFLVASECTWNHGEWVGEIEQSARDGRSLVVQGRWTLVRDEQGQPKSILAINTDLTERKKLEQQFLRMQRMESIGTLAGGIAHDLNNVLGPIITALDLLQMKFPDADSMELLGIISTSAHRGADMVRQVLSFARGVEGRRMEVQVKHLVRDIEKIANDTFLKNVAVRTSIPGDLWTVSGDPTQLHQVLLNLCVNARDAMPDGGTLTLSASNVQMDAQYAALDSEAHASPYVVLRVEDTGIGMPPDVIEKIFDPFFTTKELGKGTGLGLSTTLAIVKSHGGFLRVYSELGHGTTFKIHLPAQTERSTVTAEEIAAEFPRGNGDLILVVDDESSMRLITQQTLETFGYQVVLASDGAEAAAVYAAHGKKIAAVLTDMMMPTMDGPTLFQVLRKMNPAVRIIAASGLATNDRIAASTNLGVKTFLPKPYTAETLLKTLKKVLSPM